MFTLQAGTLLQRLVGSGMPASQADAIAETIGQCTQELHHNGPVEINYDWPANADASRHAALTVRAPGGRAIFADGDIEVGDEYGVYIGSGSSRVALGAGHIKVGKLNGSLGVSGSTTFSEWTYNGTAWSDTGRDYSIIDWLQRGNESLPSGTKVIALRVFDETYLAISAETN